jgi:hypothetical protein
MPAIDIINAVAAGVTAIISSIPKKQKLQPTLFANYQGQELVTTGSSLAALTPALIVGTIILFFVLIFKRR